MPEIDFTIDATTGNLQMHVKGIAGRSCDDVARLAKQLLGEPGREETTPEYRLHAVVQARQQVRSQ